MRDPGLQKHFQPDPELIYLDAATYGLPPQATVDALQRALSTWQRGTANWIDDWDREGDVCRELFGAMIGASTDEVALIPTVSAGAALLAASLPPGSTVISPEDEFTSMLLPFVAAEERNNVTVRRVPFDDIANAIDESTTLVVASHVRSQDGRVLDLESVTEATARYGAQLALDATHSVPVLPIDPWIEQVDYLICHGYKQLLSPRGSGYMYLARSHWQSITPWYANWRSVQPVYGRSYGGGLSYNDTASRFDMALAWHSYAGARHSLELLLEWQTAGLLEWPVHLANRLATGLGLSPTGSSILAPRMANADEAERALAIAGIKAASRGGNIRLSPHVYNTESEIDAAVAAMSSVAPIEVLV